MPIYEYQCEKCAHQFETIIMSRSEEPPACPECGHREVVRRLSAVAVGGLQTEKSCAPSGSGFS